VTPDPTPDRVSAARTGDDAARGRALAAVAHELARRGTPTDEHDDATVDAIAGGLVDLVASRGAATVAVRSFNPTAERHGYVTPGTVLQTSAPDQPFLVDTIVERLRGRGLRPRAMRHPIVGLERDPDDGGLRIVAPTAAVRESLVHVELDRRLDATEIAALEDEIRGALIDARTVVDAFDALRRRMGDVAAALGDEAGDGVTEPDARDRAEGELGAGTSTDDADEVAAFLRWLADDNAVLLGAADHALPDGAPIPGSGLGVLADGAAADAGRDPIDAPADRTVRRIAGGDRIVLGHTMALSPVHRRVRMEDIAVRVTGPDGEPTLRRIVLLFGSRAYATPSSETPLLRGTLLRVLHAERLLPGSHDWKALVTLFDGFPKEELFALSVEDLRRTLMALVDLTPGEVALRSRTSVDGRAATVVLAVPRPSYDAMVRDGLSDLVRDRFGASDVSAHEVLGEGDHVQLHLRAYNPAGLREVDADALERAAATLARSWDDRLREALVERVGEERGPVLAARWAGRLPGQYKAGVDPTVAVRDVEALERLTTGGEQLVVTLKHEANEGERTDLTRVAFVVRGAKVELSRAMPILEHLGLHVVEERPTRLRQAEPLWVQDFGVLGPDGEPLDLDEVGDRVAAAIDAVWRGETESDPLNRLVVTAGLDHERLEALRAYRSYRQRIGSRYTERYQNEVIVQHPEIVQRLVRYFELRFGADRVGGPDAPRDEAAEAELRDEILELLDDVPQLDHDRILRNQLQLVDATYRTNAYRPGRQAIAFKLRSDEVPAIPRPTPLWEIYVHAPDVEGVHLRGGMIARGGLRWSDRADFRTEVLGLMRAQMVKNAVIVPAGAKGGFLLRDAPTDAGALRDAVRAGYVRFISALLDVTDDLVDGEIVHPDGVRVLDADDHYLVVAADKGTATFSDVANDISTGRGFWLGDAFASGGSAGYDHKALGITARGAWESVKRHFRERGVDPEVDPITAVGIGDMSGDVFGNGMLLSRSLRLVAAYDHRHVFLDPDPVDPVASWTERRRLHDLGRSSWDDYDRALISDGGGVFPRTLKRIPIDPRVRATLGIDDEELPPNELIQAILRAPVDLLWNGGIGTVVKASHERDADAQDRASDGIRVDGRDLRARVVGEGGNLGFTQAARIEFAMTGGGINADFIDNSAGVDSSDHEVNLKILLAGAIRRGALDPGERDGLLEEVTDEVVEHVLAHSYSQARILTREERRAPERTYAADELMTTLEERGELDRAVHDLPGADELAERRAAGRGLTRPELAVLVALAKLDLTRALLASDHVDDPALHGDLAAYFPASLAERFAEDVRAHPLRRELVATAAAGELVDAMGPTFVARRAAEFAVDAARVARAFRITVEATDARRLWRELDALTGIDPDLQWRLRADVESTVRAVSRWHVARGHDPLQATIDAHRDGTREIRGCLDERDVDDRRAEELQAALDGGAPEPLAREVTAGRWLHMAPNVVACAASIDRPVATVARAAFHTTDALGLDPLHQTVDGLRMPTRTLRWAVQALRDDLLEARVAIAAAALTAAPDRDPVDAVDAHVARRADGVERLRTFLRALSQGAVADDASAVAASSLAVRQLQAIAR